MKSYKKSGISQAEYFLQILERRLSDREDIGCTVEAFNNCREQGYIIGLHYEKEKKFDSEAGLTLYIHNNRWSDEPTMTYENKECMNPLYSEEAFANRQITSPSVEQLVERALEIIENKMKEMN